METIMFKDSKTDELVARLRQRPTFLMYLECADLLEQQAREIENLTMINGLQGQSIKLLAKELDDAERDAEEWQKEVDRLTKMCDALLNHCDKEQGECSVCATIVCPSHDPYHFHHDGCPSCAGAR